MTQDLSTITVASLFEEKLIGRRLQQLLAEAKIENLHDLQVWLDCMGLEKFAMYKNFGTKCREELMEIIRNYGLYLPDPQLLVDTASSGPVVEAAADLDPIVQSLYDERTPEAQVLESLYPRATDILAFIMHNTHLPRLDREIPDPNLRHNIWMLLIDILEKALVTHSLQQFVMIEGHVREFLEANKARLKKLKWDKLKVTYRQPLVHRQLLEEYNGLIKMYPKRTQNAAFEYFPDYREAMMRFCLDHLDMTEMHNCGNKSYADLLEIFEEFYTSSPDVFYLSGEDLALNALEAEYPQLAGSGTKFVYEFQKEHGRLPLWFLLSRFILTNNHQVVVHFRTVHGIGRGRNYGYSTASAARYSGDGLNELIQQADFEPHYPAPEDPAWDVYPFLNLPLIGKDSFDFAALSREENLSDLNFDNFLGVIQFLRGGKIFTLANNRFWIQEEISADYPVREIIARLQEIIDQERDTPITLDVRSLFTFREDRELDRIKADVTLKLATLLGFLPTEDKYILSLAPNAVNVPEEIIGILAQSSTPLSLGDILTEFRARHPEHKIRNERLMRPFVNNTPQIVLVNRRRGYTIQDRLQEMLTAPLPKKRRARKEAAQEACETPEPAQAPAAQPVEEEQPDLSLHTIKQTTADQAVLPGLEPEVAVAEAPAEIPAKPKGRRGRKKKQPPMPEPFAPMLEEYTSFITDNGKFPATDSGDTVEIRLKNWRDDIVARKIPCTPHEFQNLLRAEMKLRKLILPQRAKI